MKHKKGFIDDLEKILAKGRDNSFIKELREIKGVINDALDLVKKLKMETVTEVFVDNTEFMQEEMERKIRERIKQVAKNTYNKSNQYDSNHKNAKSDDDEKFNILLKKFCIQYVKMKDPIEDLYVKSKLKGSQPNKSFFTTIFTVDLSEWLGEWCGNITEAYCSAVFTA